MIREQDYMPAVKNFAFFDFAPLRFCPAMAAGAKLALAGFHAGVFLVDDIDPAMAADHAAIFIARLGRFQGVTDLHLSLTSWSGLMGGAVCRPAFALSTQWRVF